MEFVNYKLWPTLADVRFDFRKQPENAIIPARSCVVHFHTEFTDFVFAQLNKLYQQDESLKYILISSESDYGLCLQKDYPVCRDLNKAFYMVDTSNCGYKGIKLDVRCNIDRCKIEDKYSVKMYAYTDCTFNKIPPNVVRWYCVNNQIEDSRIINIPFGIPDWFQDIAEPHFTDRISKVKNNRIYVAFQANTMERFQLINSVNTDDRFLVRRQTVSHEQYIKDMMSCGYCLSPAGNGLDCYRTLEAMYLGTIPIVDRNSIVAAYRHTPFLCAGEPLANIYDILPSPLAGTMADFGYWRRMLSDERKNLEN